METKTQSSISKSKGARFSPAATSCQFDQLYLSQSFGETISEAGKNIRYHSLVLTSCSSAMSRSQYGGDVQRAGWWKCWGQLFLWYYITLAMSPAASSFGSPAFSTILSCPVELLIFFFFFSVFLSFSMFLLFAITKVTS